MLTPKKLALAHTLGPVVVDIAGTVLTEHEIRRLEHPMTGAVILFTRYNELLDRVAAKPRVFPQE